MGAVMFGTMIDLSEAKRTLRRLFDAQWRVLAGVAFMALAMAAIQYEEVIAPEVARFSDGYAAVELRFRQVVHSLGRPSEPVPLRLRWRGQEHDYPDITTSEWAEYSPTRFESKFLLFRRVQLHGPNECRW